MGNNVRHKNFRTQNLIYKKQQRIDNNYEKFNRYDLGAGVEEFYDSMPQGYAVDEFEESVDGADYEDLTQLEELSDTVAEFNADAIEDATDDLND